MPLRGGFLYLVALMDWYSRYVLSWRLSNSLDAHFCAEALEAALARGTPEIFNTDQGAQFTSRDFTRELDEAVNKQLAAGWQPYGNPYATENPVKDAMEPQLLAQAMVKVEN